MSLINNENGMVYCADDEEIYAEVLDAYVDQGAEYLEKFPMYKEAENFAEYAIVAHSIKSTSLTIGADELSALAKTHEFAGKASDMAAIEATYDKLVTDYKAVLNEAAEMCGRPERF